MRYVAPVDQDDQDQINKNSWAIMCPYGMWTCRNGREVLFNRRYYPVLERRPGRPAMAAALSEWVDGITQQSWLWNERDNPLIDDATLARVNAVLISWGVPKMPPKPVGLRSFYSAPRNDFRNPWDFVLPRVRP
jgi:hypothetical protein